jgi:hypothetical protein
MRTDIWEGMSIMWSVSIEAITFGIVSCCCCCCCSSFGFFAYEKNEKKKNRSKKYERESQTLDCSQSMIMIHIQKTTKEKWRKVIISWRNDSSKTRAIDRINNMQSLFCCCRCSLPLILQLIRQSLMVSSSETQRRYPSVPSFDAIKECNDR